MILGAENERCVSLLLRDLIIVGDLVEFDELCVVHSGELGYSASMGREMSEET